MNRYFLPAADWSLDQLVLRGDEARHCAQVMREGVGASIEIFDGAGRCAECEITSSSRSEVVARIISITDRAAPQPEITLHVAIPKGKLMDWIVQKAVEMGVNRIVPLVTERTIVRLDGKEAAKKVEKWQRVALEACKQCGQDHLVEIAPVARLADIELDGGVGLVGSLETDARPLAERVESCRGVSAVHLAIGPEGDFSAVEYDHLRGRGFLPTGLGPLVLRVETAALVMLSGIVLFARRTED